jgi:sugar lactone lactonase YvrE
MGWGRSDHARPMGRTGQSVLGTLVLFALVLVGCSADSLQPRDGGPDAPASGSGGGAGGGGVGSGGTTGQGAAGGGGMTGPGAAGGGGGTTGLGAAAGGGGTTGLGAAAGGGIGGACQPDIAAQGGRGGLGGMPIATGDGGAGGADTSTTWCGADSGFPDDSSPPPDQGLGTLSLLAGAPGGPGRADGIGLSARFGGLGLSARFGGPRGIGSDGAGKLYVADSANRTIRQIDIATRAVTTLAGSNYDRPPGRAPCSIDGTAKAARFTTPVDVIPGGDGNLYVSDIDAHVIRKIDIANGAVTTLAGSPNVPGSTDGVGSAARFNGPGSLTTDRAGHLYVADTLSFTIRQVDLATGAVTTVAGSPLATGWCDRTGADARFGPISGLVSDRAGHLYVVDGYIRKVDLVTHAVTTEFGTDVLSPAGEGPRQRVFATAGGIEFDGVGALYVNGTGGVYRIEIATSTRTMLDNGSQNIDAIDLAIDGAGILYLIQSASSQIWTLGPASGAPTPFAGSVANPGFADGSGADARFFSPLAVATDGAGNIYIAEQLGHRILMIAAGTSSVTTLAGDPTYDGYESLDGVGAAARFASPVALVADEAGTTVYVSDSSGSFTIRKLTVATRTVTTLAGAFDQAGYDDGVGSAARFGGPSGLALDRHGNLFVIDDFAIRQVVVATGVVTTLAGAHVDSSPQDGVGADARFAGPLGIATDGEGTLYVADYDDVRTVDVPTATVSTVVVGVSGAQVGHYIALDAAASTLYVTYAGTIQKLDLATEAVTTVVGDLSRSEVLLGPLPGALGSADGIALLQTRDLVIPVRENAILTAHFF